jgi:hypothetical protein
VLFHLYAPWRISPGMPDILHFSRIGLVSGFMKKWLQDLRVILSSAFPSAASPYWRALPLRRMKSLLAGAFFSTAVVGFAGDLAQLNVRPLGRGFFWPAFFGAGAVVGLVATINRDFSPINEVLAASTGLRSRWSCRCRPSATVCQSHRRTGPRELSANRSPFDRQVASGQRH